MSIRLILNLAWSQCSNQEISLQENHLTQAWKAAFSAMGRVSVKAAVLLLNEQRAWIRYKDAACQYYSSGNFGREGQVLDFGACKASIIADRIDALGLLKKDMDSK